MDKCSTSGATTTCYTALDVHPDTTGSYGILFNGSVYYWNYFNLQTCDTTAGVQTCSTASNWSSIQTLIVCPSGSGEANLSETGSNPVLETVVCQYPPIITQPPPTGCKSCVGNPIYAATGLKTQPETDYTATTGLAFVRTYRSDSGFWASVGSSAFIDYSQPNGTTTNNCYQSYYVNPNTQANVSNCFPYISSATAAYQLTTADGRYIQFTGPNTAVTQNADINERVTQVTVGGVTEWQVTREDDSTEFYSTAGSLLERVERGGRTFTFTYSTSSTSSTIAPRAGLLLSESDAFGHTLSWQYTSAAQISQMTDPAGGIYQYSYNGTGNLTGVTYPDGTTKTYSYDESAYTDGTSLPNALTGITDESDVRYATFSYDSYGRGVNTQHAGGVESYTLSYSGSTPGVQATVTDPLGANRVYTFETELSYLKDSNQNQPAASGTSTVNQTESFDANGNTSQLTDFNGNVTTYVFELSRNLETSRTEAYGTSQARTITTTWSTSFRQPALISVYAGGTATGTPLRTTSFTYNNLGGLLTKTVTDTTVTPNVSRTWTYTYDSYGRMLTAKGPRTDVNSTTTYTYYTCTTGSQCGELETVTDALGHVTTYNTYNGQGQPLTITDPNGVVTTLTYDKRLRLLSRQIGTETTSFSYYPTGLLKQVTRPDSSYLLYTYDGAHRLIQITDTAGNSIKYTLDAMGNHTAENAYDPSGVLHRTHTWVISVLNNVYQDISAAGTAAVTTTFGYDNNANQISIAAPLSRNTANTYDALNRLSQSTNPDSGITKFAYDANDNLTSVVDPRSLSTTYAYNGFGDVIKLTSPDTGATANTYDSGGNLATSTDARGAVSNYTYDALNRVTSAAYTLGSTTDLTETYTYDAGTDGIGHLTGASDANQSTSWTYDFLGRVISKTQTVAGTSLTVAYAYTNGDLTFVTFPTSAGGIGYGYNTNHQITSVSAGTITLLNSATYEPFGPVNGWTWGDTTSEVRAYNTDGNLAQVNGLESHAYTYDSALRITAITNSSNSALSWTYGYDLLDRITSGTTTSTTLGWTYDANSNRLTQTGSVAGTYTVASASNRLSSITGSPARTYVYDVAGHTVSYAGTTLGYYNNGRLETATASGATTTYVYNALSQRIEKSGDPAVGTVIVMYDEGGHLLGEYPPAPGYFPYYETAWLGDIPVATMIYNSSETEVVKNGEVSAAAQPLLAIENPTILYVHADHLNAPRMLTNSGVIAWRWDTDPFGTVAPTEYDYVAGVPTVYNLRYPGQHYDYETGLNYNVRRDYDPMVGRYVESDPLLQLSAGFFTRPGTLNRLLFRTPQLLSSYTYVSDNPISRRDPMGLLDNPADIVQLFPPLPPWNGNLWPGFTEQDGVCTLPGCIGRTANANPPVLACCQTHDACYTQNRCNASSWILQGTLSQSCQQCNAAATSCITTAILPRPFPWLAHPEAIPFMLQPQPVQ